MKRNRIITLTFLLCALTTLPLFAADVEASAGADVATAYVWRGLTFNDGMVFQPWMDITKGPFNVNVWGNYDIDDYDETLNGAEYSEIDLTASYTFELETVSITTGIIEYTFPGGGTGTTELFADTSMEPMENFSVGLGLYYDIDEVKDYYLQIYAGYSMEPMDKVTVDFRLSLGMVGDEYSASGDGGMFDMTFTVAGSYAYKDDISFGATLIYTTTMDEDILPEQDAETVIALGASYTF